MEKTNKHLVFLHGLFMTPTSWQPWVRFFESQGYTCHTPAYPFHERSRDELWESPMPGLGKLNLNEVVAHLSAYIDQLPEPPIVIGHSMGGLAVQKLINKGKVSAGICLNPAPPQGIFTFQWSFFKANFPVINPFKGNSVFKPTVEWFQYAFCNYTSIEETQKLFDAFVVPESRNIPRSSTGAAGKIDFKKAHVPLLIIAGEKDHIVPPVLNVRNARAYKNSEGITELRIFAGRTHGICMQPGWEEVAGFCKNWIESVVGK